ncbi:response regulator transcription factor [Cohnella sp. JJ-181]|uniref:response regulator transcription factor n=1 Tax=Cohnella rhizoplanae TaxID=2974897 RepID=UPI0022FF72DD|nr:response regulator [Cohnella sp. JJ-181]CAI6067511.1 Protein-glutamate methylesterase/protein-glutamine glutaminase [Cohnella sp. JJ-181]
MIRLLIVDNERWIVDSLLDLFGRPGKLELETFGAYSAHEALDLLGRMKIDVVLSDIRMPGMDGLALQREIVRHWPWCKIVFLSGYDDFDYIQQALRGGGVDYLLKTEGHEAIVAAVERAAAQLYEAVESRQLIRNAERQMQLARPLLVNEYLLALAGGDAEALRKRRDRLRELQLPLDGGAETLLILGRVDDWRDGFSGGDKDLMLYAIANIAEEYFAKSLSCVSVTFEQNKLLWFLQPGPAAVSSGDPQQSTGDATRRFVRFVQGTIETIQGACKQLLQLSVSFAAADEPRDWERLPGQFHALRRLLGRGLGLGQELILLDRPDGSDGAGREPDVRTHETRSRLDKIGALAAYLENGQSMQFFAEYAKLMELGAGKGAGDELLKLEIYYSLVPIFLSEMNRWGIQGELSETVDLGRLTRYDVHPSWHAAEEYFAALAERLFERKRAERSDREDDLILHVRRYVEHNLAGDLSLTRIGEVVGYNPYYLTRLYKQLTGEGLTDYIAATRLARAQKLLADNQLIVQDISRAVGFMTEQSFYRFFKKETGLTPQEYKERSAISKTDR